MIERCSYLTLRRRLAPQGRGHAAAAASRLRPAYFVWNWILPLAITRSDRASITSPAIVTPRRSAVPGSPRSSTSTLKEHAGTPSQTPENRTVLGDPSG